MESGRGTGRHVEKEDIKQMKRKLHLRPKNLRRKDNNRRRIRRETQ